MRYEKTRLLDGVVVVVVVVHSTLYASCIMHQAHIMIRHETFHIVFIILSCYITMNPTILASVWCFGTVYNMSLYISTCIEVEVITIPLINLLKVTR
jgi:hypothetical protein